MPDGHHCWLGDARHRPIQMAGHGWRRNPTNRLRTHATAEGQQNSIGELFTQQVIQGIGSGIIHTSLLVPPQIVVSHSQMPQVLSLTLTMSYLGSSVGSAIAGGIYTNTLRPSLWAYLGRNATQDSVDQLYNSITGVLLSWCDPKRDAVNLAVSRQRSCHFSKSWTRVDRTKADK